MAAKKRDIVHIVNKTTTKYKRNWFLGIGIDSYPNFQHLSNAVKDMLAIEKVLQDRYGFDKEYSKVLINETATYENLFKELEHLKSAINTEDNLVIYYSGHGHYEKKTEKGAWIPYDAEKSSTAKYFRNGILTDFLVEIEALHILLISDACFSGSILYQRDTNEELPDPIEKYSSRWVLCSGRHNEKVSDGTPGGHSPFAKSLLFELRQNTTHKLSILELGDKVIKMTNGHYSGQIPQCAPALVNSHQGGHFVFGLLEEEHILWNRCVKEENLEDLHNFVSKFPRSKNRQNAIKLITKLEKEQAFQTSVESNDIALLTTFLKSYYNDSIITKTAEKIDEIYEDLKKFTDLPPAPIQNEKADEDSKAWKKATEGNTLNHYMGYLKQFPQGKYLIWAKSVIDKIQKKNKAENEQNESIIWSSTLKIDTVSAYKKYLEKFKEGTYSHLALTQIHNAIIKKIKSSLTPIKSGVFTMIDASQKNLNAHLDIKVNDFSIAKKQVTVEEYVHFVEQAGYDYPSWHEKSGYYEKGYLSNIGTSFSHENCPIVGISWYDAIEFCNWLSVKSGLQKVYTHEKGQWVFNRTANGYRLPSEAEWEYSARGGHVGRNFIFSGSNDIKDVGWYKNNSLNQLHSTGSKQSNELGLYDMSGNSWEWCWDRYSQLQASNWLNVKKILENPIGPNEGNDRVIRGGAWSSQMDQCKVNFRNYIDPKTKSLEIGLRLCQNSF